MIELNGIIKQYQGRDGPFNALNDISVHIKKEKNSVLSVKVDPANRRCYG